MVFAFGPGCDPCCGCIELEDNFDREDSTSIGDAWSEVSGDWQISSNRLSIGTSNAVVVASSPSSQVAMKYIVSMKGGTVNNTARFIFDYIDVDNYKFIEVKFASSGSVPAPGYMRIAEIVSGSENVLKTVNYSITHTEFSTLEVCIPAVGGIYAKMATRVISLQSISVSSPVFGLGTGATVSGSVLFDTISSTIVSLDCEQCSGCPYCDEHEDEGMVDYLVTIPTGFWANVTGDPTACLEAEGEFICNWSNSTGLCTWEYKFDGVKLKGITVTLSSTGVLSIVVQLFCGVFGIGGSFQYVTWTVSLGSPDAEGRYDCAQGFMPLTAEFCRQNWTFVQCCKWDGDTTQTPGASPCRVTSLEPITIAAIL